LLRRVGFLDTVFSCVIYWREPEKPGTPRIARGNAAAVAARRAASSSTATAAATENGVDPTLAEIHKLPPPVTARDLGLILRRRGRLALATFGVVVAATLGLTSLMKPVYEAKARVRVENSAPRGIPTSLMDLLNPGGGAPLETQMELIRSRAVLSEVIRKARLETVPEELAGRVRLAPGPGGQIIDVGVRARTGPEAQRTANTLANVFIEYARQQSESNASRAQYRLRQSLKKAEADKVAAERAYNAFLKQMGVSDPAQLFASRATQTLSVQQGLRDARKALEVKLQEREKLRAQIRAINPEVVTGYARTKNQAIDAYEFQLLELERERRQKLLDFDPSQPEVQEIVARIAETRSLLEQAKQNTYSTGSKSVGRNPDYSTVQSNLWASEREIGSTRAGIAANEAAVRRLETEQKRLTDLKTRFEDLARERATATENFQAVNRGVIQIDLQKSTSAPNIDVFDPAVLPPAPVSPKPLLNGLMAIFLGAFLAVAAALLAEYLSATGHDDAARDGLPQVAGVPLLGSVPVALPAPVAAAGGLPVPVDAGASPWEEDAFREVGYCLAHLGHGAAAKGNAAPVVLLSGTRSDETTASVAAQLAATLIRDGLRVTLVDADRAHPRLNRVFGAPDAPGLADVLAGRARARDILHVGADGSLRFLAAGAPENNAPATERGLRALFKDLSHGGDTDLVLVSGPSVWAVRAVMPLERAADGLVLVAPPDASPAETVARARRLLTNGTQPNLVGVVLGRPAAAPAPEEVEA
jgi:uncharacterized protein involved in exopolysaccharide biosynthesis/Mrp family chromosome partitioning ATPase